MPYREQIRKAKLEVLLREEENYAFPEFLRMLRRMMGTRRVVAEDTLISHHRLEYLERGKFERMPEEDELITIGAYFGVPVKMLKKKAKQYLNHKHHATC